MFKKYPIFAKMQKYNSFQYHIQAFAAQKGQESKLLYNYFDRYCDCKFIN